MKKILTAAVLSVSMFSSLVFSQTRDPREEKLTYMIGEKIENFEAVSLDGKKKVNLEGLKGKKVFVNFTTTWCPDCLEEKEIMGPEYKEKYQNRDDIEFVIVFGPYKADNAEKAEHYMKEKNYNFPAYYDGEKELYAQFGVKNIPVSFLINEEGILEDVNIESGYKNMKYFK